jgi:hypothetical protein
MKIEDCFMSLLLSMTMSMFTRSRCYVHEIDLVDIAIGFGWYRLPSSFPCRVLRLENCNNSFTQQVAV